MPKPPPKNSLQHKIFKQISPSDSKYILRNEKCQALKNRGNATSRQNLLNANDQSSTEICREGSDPRTGCHHRPFVQRLCHTYHTFDVSLYRTKRRMHYSPSIKKNTYIKQTNNSKKPRQIFLQPKI